MPFTGPLSKANLILNQPMYILILWVYNTLIKKINHYTMHHTCTLSTCIAASKFHIGYNSSISFINVSYSRLSSEYIFIGNMLIKSLYVDL